MKKTQSEHSFFKNKELRKILLVMKNSLLIFLIAIVQVSASVSIHGQNLTLMAEGKTVLQEITVTGRVTDAATGAPLPGVSIVIQGTTIGTTTNVDGEYSLSNVPPDAILVFSFIGMMSQETAVDARRVINVAMETETIGIDEVVAVGYGTQRKVNLTGSVAAVEGEQLARQPIAQASQALTGLIPGLTAIQSSGQPGYDNATLRIRGIGSIGASNNPLILIDGIEGDINRIDAGDIESISVLKDAASAAIYGSRGSNGVILITTKRAQEGVLSVNYRNYVGWQDVTDKFEFVGALDFLKYSGASQEEIDQYAINNRENPDVYPDSDWVKELFTENGFQQYHSLSLNGGTENISLLASFSYLDQGANIKSYGFQRYNGRLNSDIKFSEKFDVTFDLNFHKQNRSEPFAQLGDVLNAVYRIPPIYPAIHSDGSWGSAWANNNPMAQVSEGGYRNNTQNYFRGVLRANYEPIPGLIFSVMYAPEYNDGYAKSFERIHYIIADWEQKITYQRPDRNNLSMTNSRAFTDNFNALATYTKRIGNHNFTLLGGYEFIKYQYEVFGASRMDFILQDYQVLNAGAPDNRDNSGSATHWSLVSYFSRLNYAFKDRYLFEANVRRDESSRFAKGNRVGIFPSFSAGWRLSEEEFINNLGLFSNMTLRASWGVLGNQQIGSDFPYASSIVLGGTNYVLNDAIVTGAAQQVLANRNIQWEKSETINFGVDVGFLNQRLTFTAEYYKRETKDALLDLPIPYTIGLSPSVQNAGNLENKGWDFSGNWRDRINNFSYGIGLNIADVKNKVTNLAGIGPIISGNSIIEVGSPLNSIYGYESIGIFQDEESIANAPAQFGALSVGNIQYKDQNGDGMINPDDRVKLGNSFPRLNYGLDLFAQFKGFDFAVSLVGVGKRDWYQGGDRIWPLFNAGKIQKWHVEEFWSPENPDAKFPKIAPTSFGSNDVQTSSTWVWDASYLRVRNITLGYSLPQPLLNRININDLRVYLSGQNIFTFKKLPKGVDPVGGSLYPILASYNIGIDLKF